MGLSFWENDKERFATFNLHIYFKVFLCWLANLNYNKFYPKLAKIQIHKIVQFLKKNKSFPSKTQVTPCMGKAPEGANTRVTLKAAVALSNFPSASGVHQQIHTTGKQWSLKLKPSVTSGSDILNNFINVLSLWKEESVWVSNQ